MKNEILSRTVGVYTENEYLLQKIRLELIGKASVVDLTATDAECDVILIDGDDPKFDTERGLIMKRGGGDISLPFRIGELAHLITKEKNAYIELSKSERAARVGAGTVKLTELEYTLLSSLVAGGGEFISRERIKAILGDKGEGLINVYVHYLREKLETCGEKIIISSRKNGYAIDKKFIKEDA